MLEQFGVRIFLFKIFVVATATICILGWSKEDFIAENTVSPTPIQDPIQQKVLPVVQASLQLQDHGAVQVIGTHIYCGNIAGAAK